MKKERKLNFLLLSAMFLIIIGCGMLIAGFIVPPLGIINSSVLIAFGEVSTFAGSLFGVDYKYKYKMYTKEGHNE